MSYTNGILMILGTDAKKLTLSFVSVESSALNRLGQLAKIALSFSLCCQVSYLLNHHCLSIAEQSGTASTEEALEVGERIQPQNTL